MHGFSHVRIFRIRFTHSSYIKWVRGFAKRTHSTAGNSSPKYTISKVCHSYLLTMNSLTALRILIMTICIDWPQDMREARHCRWQTVLTPSDFRWPQRCLQERRRYEPTWSNICRSLLFYPPVSMRKNTVSMFACIFLWSQSPPFQQQESNTLDQLTLRTTSENLRRSTIGIVAY